MAQTVKKPLAMQEILVQSLGWEDPLEKEVATHSSSTLDWKIPWAEESGGLQSMGLQRVGYIEQLILKCLSGTDQPLCHVGLVYMFGYGSHISEPPALRTGPLPHTGMSCLREHGPLASD